jgi:etoposide-induced 2.4 mRNA
VTDAYLRVTQSYRALVTVNYFGVIFLLRYIPYVGPILSFLYACIVDSYYAFE